MPAPTAKDRTCRLCGRLLQDAPALNMHLSKYCPQLKQLKQPKRPPPTPLQQGRVAPLPSPSESHEPLFKNAGSLFKRRKTTIQETAAASNVAASDLQVGQGTRAQAEMSTADNEGYLVSVSPPWTIEVSLILVPGRRHFPNRFISSFD